MGQGVAVVRRALRRSDLDRLDEIWEGVLHMWFATAALVVEIVSPGDKTWEKLPFYAAHSVDESLIVDPRRSM